MSGVAICQVKIEIFCRFRTVDTTCRGGACDSNLKIYPRERVKIEGYLFVRTRVGHDSLSGSSNWCPNIRF